MNTLVKRLLRYTLYTAYFGICLFLFGLLNLPYEEAEDLLSRHARVHLNAELEIGESILSPTGQFSVDSASLTFYPTVAEAEAIAQAEAALTAWEAQAEALKSLAEEADEDSNTTETTDNPDTKKTKSGQSNEADESAATDGTPENDSTKKLRKTKKKTKNKLGVKPKVPSPPLPIRFDGFKVSTAPLALIDDIKDDQLFNERNEIVLETTLNDSPLRIELRREVNQMVFAFSISDFDLELFTLLQRFTGFPIGGMLTVDVNLNIPLDNDQYNFVETEGNVSFFLKEDGLIGPATIKSKMGEVTLPPIAFETFELDLKVGKRRLAIEEFKIEGKDLNLCGTGHISLNRGRPRAPRPSRRKANAKGPSKTKKPIMPSRTPSGQLSTMLGTSRSNLFVRFKFSDRYMELKENSLLRLVLGDRTISKGKDADGFIGHKTTARLNGLTKPLSWVASPTSPHRKAPNQCGGRETNDQKAKSKKTTKKTSKKRPRKPRRGRSAKPFKPSKSKGLKTNPFSTGTKPMPKKKRSKDSAPIPSKPELETSDDEDEEEDDIPEPQGGDSDSSESESGANAADDEDTETEESE